MSSKEKRKMKTEKGENTDKRKIHIDSQWVKRNGKYRNWKAWPLEGKSWSTLTNTIYGLKITINVIIVA